MNEIRVFWGHSLRPAGSLAEAPHPLSNERRRTSDLSYVEQMTKLHENQTADFCLFGSECVLPSNSYRLLIYRVRRFRRGCARSRPGFQQGECSLCHHVAGARKGFEGTDKPVAGWKVRHLHHACSVDSRNESVSGKGL